MFFTPQQISHSRDSTLSNLLSLSNACIEASHRFAELVSGASRDAIHHGSKQFAQLGHGQLDSLSQFPAALWLEGSARSSRVLDHAYGIFGETQKAWLESTEAQIRILDEIVFSSIRRAEKATPWEGEFALGILRTSLQTAEQTLHGVTAAVVDTVETSEQEVHQITESLSENKAPTRRTGKRSTPPTS